VTASESRLPVAVLGGGYLVTRQAERLAASDRFELRCVFDLRADQAARVAERVGTRAAAALDEALEGVDAVVVATSTDGHREVAGRALEAGRHVLVEKPLTGRVADAEALVRLAARRGLVLHTGFVERFNSAVAGLFDRIPAPVFVESHRLAPPVGRSLDIDVVQDLMVHDIDLSLAFVGAEPETVNASGTAVLTDRVDIANARFSFAGGGTANLTASRVSLERTRKFRMFLPGAYVSADCGTGTAQVYRLKPGSGDLVRALRSGTSPMDMARFLDREVVGGDGGNALDREHDAFRRAVRGEPNRGVTGSETLRVLRVMGRVEEAVQGMPRVS